ncbi:telomere-protecting terminal protein Tpg [Streptomyces solincola]|uniref:telomere-protecting terminal protein Tpg n=1 Tax=Streptomyces solincola TaxID=2100817 RepID=UPI00389AC176
MPIGKASPASHRPPLWAGSAPSSARGEAPGRCGGDRRDGRVGQPLPARRAHRPSRRRCQDRPAVRERWQPASAGAARRQGTTGGITVDTRARCACSAPVGTTDDGRMRRLTVHLPPRTPAACSNPRCRSRRPAVARHRRRGFKDVYFQDGGTCALSLTDVRLQDIDYLDLDY